MADNIDELKEIVAQSLEAKGVLAKLRVRQIALQSTTSTVRPNDVQSNTLTLVTCQQAQIRKHVFDVIEEQDGGNKASENDKLASIRQSGTDRCTVQYRCTEQYSHSCVLYCTH